MNTKMLLSVVLATHNEEKNIEKCLDAVKDIADEIIVADGESTDRTVELLKKYRVLVINTTNKSNFHINKQLAMDAAHGQLILQLDADEVVDAELKHFIIELKHALADGSLSEQPAAWYLKRKNFFLGSFFEKGGQYPDPVIRLYHAGKAHLPQKNVHEQMTVDGEVAVAPGHLLHYAFPDFATYMRKFNTYTSFEAQRLYDTDVTPSFRLAVSYCIFKPLYTFTNMYIRHKGFVDGFPGFVFALMSSIFHIFTYIKLQELSYGT